MSIQKIIAEAKRAANETLNFAKRTVSKDSKPIQQSSNTNLPAKTNTTAKTNTANKTTQQASKAKTSATTGVGKLQNQSKNLTSKINLERNGVGAPDIFKLEKLNKQKSAVDSRISAIDSGKVSLLGDKNIALAQRMKNGTATELDYQSYDYAKQDAYNRIAQAEPDIQTRKTRASNWFKGVLEGKKGYFSSELIKQYKEDTAAILSYYDSQEEYAALFGSGAEFVKPDGYDEEIDFWIGGQDVIEDFEKSLNNSKTSVADNYASTIAGSFDIYNSYSLEHKYLSHPGLFSLPNRSTKKLSQASASEMISHGVYRPKDLNNISYADVFYQLFSLSRAQELMVNYEDGRGISLSALEKNFGEQLDLSVLIFYSLKKNMGYLPPEFDKIYSEVGNVASEFNDYYIKKYRSQYINAIDPENKDVPGLGVYYNNIIPKSELKSGKTTPIYNKWRDPDGLDWFASVVQDGLSSAGASVVNGADTLLDIVGNVLGTDMPGDVLNGYKATLNENSNFFHDKQVMYTNEFLGSDNAEWGDMFSNVVESIPALVVAYMSGFATLGASSGATLASSSSGASAVVSQMAKNPSFWYSFTSTVGGEYDNALSNGATESEAALSAIITSLLNAGVETYGGIEGIPNNIKKGGSAAVLSWVKSMIEEGSEEVVQGIVQKSVSKLLYDDSVKLASSTDENAILNPSTIGKEFGGGAFAAGVLGMGTNVVNSMQGGNVTSAPQGYDSIVKNDSFADLYWDNSFSSRELRAIDTVGKNLGVNIEFVDDLSDSHGDFANGQYSADGKTLYVNKNSTDPFAQVVLHESVHGLKSVNPTAYNSLVTELKGVVGTDTREYSSVISALKFTYQKHLGSDARANTELIDEEFASFAVQHILDNPKSLKKLAQKDMNRFQRVCDNILSLLDGSIRKYSADTNSRALYEPILEKLGDARTKIEDVYLEGIGKKKSSGLNSERFSLVNIVGKKNNYGTGVFLDTNLFDNKHPRLWSGILRKYVEDNFPGKTIETYKDNGEKELIYFAKKNERVKKDGAKNSHKVIGDLSNPKGNIEKLAVVHIDELLQAPYSQEFKDENSHQWLDENGWDIRTVYLVDKNNKIYEAKLNIGNARDGRKIIYKISNVKSIDTVGKGFTVIQRELNDGSFQNWSMPKKSIPQDSSVVKKNSLPLKEPPTGEVTSDAPKAADFKTQTNPLTFRRGEADIEYGRTFQFEDNSQPSKVKDAYNQSLHLSDSVIVSTGYNYSAGRILSFNADGTVKVAIDSSLDIERKNYNVDPKQLLFVAHNDAKTVSENYNGDYNLYYNKLKETFENYFETGIINESDFEMPELQYCLNSLTHKRNMLTARLNNIFKERIDRGVATEVKESGFEVYSDEFEKDTAFASLPDEKKDEQSPVFNYGRLSEQSTALQLYDTVMTYNLAYELSEVYRANGLDTIDYGKIFDNAVDIDRVLPLKKKTNSSGSEVKFAKKNAYRNGTYMFNDFKRNLERVFGKHYKDIKFVYEHLQTAKGNYGRNIDLMRIALQQAMKTYNIKPGSIEDKVVQWYGEGEIAPNLNNKKEVKMLNELGFDVSVSSDPDVTIKFTDADLIRIFGEERAEDIKGFSQFFRKMYDSYVERVNATIAGIYPGDTDKLLKPRKDYFRHFREMGSYMEYLGQTFLEDFQISPELSGKSHATKPKRSWESFMQTRKGKRTSASAIKGFIDYVYSAEYTININPQIKEIREFSQWIRNHKIRTDSSDLNTFIRYLDTYANLLSKKTIGLDRSIADLEWTDGRKTLKILGVINNHLKSNAVMLNASTSLKQVFNVPNALNYLNHSYKLPLAVMGLAKSGVDAKLRKKYHDLFDKSDFLTERYAKSNLDKLVASKGKRALDMLVSAGDEFGCKAVWLAAYQDGLSAKVPNPFLYADDIAKKCCAGRGVGDVPIAFEQQTMKLFLPFLLEANNLRNVYRDAVFNYENTGDVNSYMAVRAGKGKVAQKLSRFSKLALFMFATCALNDLAEEMFGQRVNPDFIDNVRKSFDAALDENGGEFNARTISNGLWNTARYSVGDYLDMSNFGHFGYQLLSLFGEDPLGDAYYDSGVNMPVISTFLDIGKSFKNSKDWEKDGLAEAGFKLFSYMLPAGGSQLRKSFYGLTDYSRGGKYEYGPFASALNDGQLGSKKFDIEKSPENFVKSALFGTSSLDESKDYYNQLYIDRVSREKAADAKEDAFDAFYHDYVTEHGQDEFIKLSKELGDTSVLPFSYVPDSIQYTDFDGNPLSVDFSADERKSYQNNLNELISDEFITVSKSSAYKNADSAGKAHLLSEAKTKVVSEFNSGLRDKFKYAEVFDEYVAAHGEDDIARIVREKENYKILPFYKIDSEKEYNINGEKTVIKFSDEEIDSYSGLAQERIDNSYNDLLNSEGWDMLSDEEKSEKLMDARSKAISEVNDIIRDDYVFADVLDNYVASHGENDVVKFVKNSRNYEYLPHYEPERNKKYTLNGNEFSFELTDDQINKYSLLANEKMEASYSNLMESSEWNLLSDEEKSEKLLEARANVKSEINDFIKYDYVYKDAITDFDNKYGADNPVRQAYEYSHDATVYPYWELDDKITFTYQKVDYEYTLSKDYDPKRGKSEYDEWMEYYNGKLISNYVDNAIGKGYLQGKSPEEIYDTLSTYKADIRKNMLNVQLRNYAKGKLGLGTQSFQRVVV